MKQQPGDWSTNFWGITGYRWRFGAPMSCGRIFRGGHTDCVFDVAWGTDARSNGALLAWRPNLRSWRGDFSNCPWWLHVLFFVDMFFFLGGCFNFPESLCIFFLLGGRVTCPFRHLKNNISVMPAQNHRGKSNENDNRKPKKHTIFNVLDVWSRKFASNHPDVFLSIDSSVTWDCPAPKKWPDLGSNNNDAISPSYITISQATKDSHQLSTQGLRISWQIGEILERGFISLGPRGLQIREFWKLKME